MTRISPLFAAFLCAALSRAAEPSRPASPNASARVKAVLGYFHGLVGRTDKRLLSGQFADFGGGADLRLMNEIHAKTEHWPAILGVDYADLAKGSLTWKEPNAAAIEYWKQGGLVTVSAHLYNPANPKGGGLRDKGVDLKTLLAQGTETQARWIGELDLISAGLGELREAGVVVLWRPFHEMNGGWFWWGAQDPEAFIQVWRHMFDYLTKTKGLDNLLWVYGPNHGEKTAAYYPGDPYVDLVGLDAYTDFVDRQHIRGYEEVAALGKPFGFTEFGPHGSKDPPGDYDYRRFIDGIVRNFPKATFFMTWNAKWSLARNNHVKELLDHPWVLNREDLPGGIVKAIPGPTSASAPSAGAGAEAFVRASPRDPRYFELSDGRPYIPIGLNMVEPPRGSGSSDGLSVFEEWMKSLAANGGNYIRVWLSSSFFDVESRKSGQYEEDQARHVDEVLGLARKYGIRLKLCLEHFRTFDDSSWARKPLHLISNGGPAESVADFFDGEMSRAQFKRKLAFYAGRYGSDPAVFGWELWNEVNCVQGGDVFAWTEVMLAELHRLFPKNLCMQSLGSHDGDWSRKFYPRMMVLPGNDVAQVHRYLDQGAQYEVCHGPVDVLAADAVDAIRKLDPMRPILLAESGAVEKSHSGPSVLYAKDRDGIIIHDVLFAPFFAGAAGPGHIWHWDQYVARMNLWWQFARFARAVEGLDPPAEGFEVLEPEHPTLRVRMLRGRRTLLAWVRDPENTWRLELAEGKPPRRIAGASIRLPDDPSLVPAPDFRVRTYDPWADRWASAKIDGGAVALPEFTRSLVIRVEK